MICTHKLYSLHNDEWESILNRFENTRMMKLKEIVVSEILSGTLNSHLRNFVQLRHTQITNMLMMPVLTQSSEQNPNSLNRQI